MKIFVYFILPILFLLAALSVRRRTLDTEYNNFQLVLIWPPSFCIVDERNCNRSAERNDFTIHGMWPALDKNTKQNCSTSSTNISDVFLKLGHELGKYWWAMNKKYDNKRFWQHEYDEHGNCSAMRMGHFEYFQKAINKGKEIKEIDLLKKLRENANITPDNANTYESSRFEAAIDEAIGNKPMLSCKNDTVLYEIFICLDANATNYIPCPGSKKCPPHIKFPSKKHD